MLKAKIKTDKSYIKIPLIIFVGFLLGTSTLFGRVTPFPAAFISCFSGIDVIFVFVGSIIGFFTSGNILAAIPIIAAMLGVGGFRLFISSTKSKGSQIASAVLAGVSVCLTGIVTSEIPTDIIISAAFGVMASVTSYALNLLIFIFKNERSTAFLKPINIGALGIVFIFSISALTSFELGVFNLGITAAAVVVMIIADCFGVSGGASFAVLSAFGIALADKNYIGGALILAFAGTAIGLFKRFGKITAAAAFILSGGIAVCVFGADSHTLNTIACMLVGSVIYVALPTSFIRSKLKLETEVKKSSDISEVFAGKLFEIENAISEVRAAVDKTAETLDKSSEKDISFVYNSACDKVCKNCKRNIKCWGENYNETVRIMNNQLKKLKSGGFVADIDFPDYFGNECDKLGHLALALNEKYREYVSMMITNRKIASMREVLTCQLKSTENLLETIADEFEKTGRDYDKDAAFKVESIISSAGGKNVKAGVKNSEGGIMIEVFGEGRIKLSPEKICEKINLALQKQFELPQIAVEKNKFKLTAFERAAYGAETGFCQLQKGSEKNCGDYVDSFIDGKGYSYTILSDGMGSGPRARIDSAFATSMLIRLLESGVTLEVALDIINSSLFVKSCDESFATLDICKLDLYTGNASIYKAGGATTYIKSGKNLSKIIGKGFPVGIGQNVAFEKQDVVLADKDMIILTSDGVDINEKWLENEILNQSYSPEELAKRIAETARLSCTENREDDISVAVVKLEK